MPRYGARNQWSGRVTAIKKGAVMCQVTVALPDGLTVSSVMTLDSVKQMGLRKGARVQALVKAIHVLLVSEDR